MSSTLRDQATILDILHAGRQIVGFVRGVTQEQFLADRMMRSAVQHQLLVMGEAVKRLSATFRQEHDDIPWKRISGMRDRLIHGYDDVDLDIVWVAATEYVPDVLNRLKPFAPPRP